ATRKELVASYHEPFPQKINLISCEPLAHISDIKLIRTDTTLGLSQKAEKDTTLDLSQKAEKGMLCTVFSFPFYTVSLGLPPLPQCGIIEHIQPDAIVFVFSERINYNHFSDIRDIFCCTGMLAVNLESILEGAARTQAPTTTNYDVGSTTWVDLRRAPLQSAMEAVGGYSKSSKTGKRDTTLDLSQKAE
ncbi:hypothetical protein RJ639_024753, partial [Escallonia herrerae]